MKRFVIASLAVLCLGWVCEDVSAQLVDGFEVTPIGHRHHHHGGMATPMYGGQSFGGPMMGGSAFMAPSMGLGGCGCGGFGMCGRCRPSLRERIWGNRMERWERRHERRMNRFCRRCSRHNCGCATPLCAPTCAPTCAPVTTMVPRQCITYQQVPVTTYRTEAYCETVPVTVYQQQIRYRQVPVQSMQLVPQMTTTMVPQTTFAPQTGGCSTCGPTSGFMGGGPLGGGMMTTPGIPYPAAGVPGGAMPMSPSFAPSTAPTPDPATSSMYTPPTYSSAPTMGSQSMGVPTPTADPSLQLSPNLDTTWQTVPSRHDPRMGALDYGHSSGYRMVAYDEESTSPSTSTAGRFRAPTAAGVWQSQVMTR